MESDREARGGVRLRRSCLSVPGSSDKMLAKAVTLPADMVFVDLEDACRARCEDRRNAGTGGRCARGARVGRGDARRARQRRVHALVSPRRPCRRRGSRGGARLHRRAQGRERIARPLRRPPAGPARGRARAGAPDRPRAPDRERPRARRDRGDRRREHPHRDAHLRPGRLRSVARHAAALARRGRPRLPRRPVALRAHADRHDSAGLRTAGDRRPVCGDPGRGWLSSVRAALARARLRRQVGPPPGPDRACATRCTHRPRAVRAGGAHTRAPMRPPRKGTRRARCCSRAR